MTAIPVTIQERIPLPASVPARPASAAGGFTPADVLRILRQRLFMILTIWILVSGATFAFTWWYDKNYREYTASAYVRVDSPYPRRPMDMVEQGVAGELLNRYVADQAVLMKDETVLREALAHPAVLGTRWYLQQPDKSLIMENLRRELSVAPTTGTSYISISLAAPTADDAAIVVNTIVDKYYDRVQDMSQIEFKGELQDYRLREERLNNELKALLEAKTQFISQQMNTPGITDRINVVGETLRSYASGAVQLEQEMIQYKALYEMLSGLDASQITVSPEMQMMIQQDPTVQGLRQQKIYLEQEKEIQSQQYGANHRMMQGLQTRIDAVDKELQKAVSAKEREVREYQLNSAQTHYLNALQAMTQMKERQVEQEAKQRDLDQANIKLQNLLEQEDLVSEELKQIKQFSNQLSLVIKDRGMVRVTKFPAIKPQTPSSPQWAIWVPGGSVLGLLFAVGLALLLELMDTSMRTPRDLARHAHVPILGMVPDLDDEEIPIDRIELASHSAPRSMTAESFRAIRTNLLLSSPAERQRTVLVTSARPEEGKTAIACNLAISIGQSGRRVLLVDANFHRPTLHQVFNRPQNNGLSNALIGQAKLTDLVQTTELPNLDIITSGPIPPNPTELLAGSYLRELLEEAEGRYDQIILDGPPVLLLSDSLVLAGSLDGVIIVCRAKATSRGAVQRAREQIERVNGRIFGAILNAARVRRGGYFREQIRTYYDYQPEEVLAAQGAKALPNGGKAGGNARDAENS